MFFQKKESISFKNETVGNILGAFVAVSIKRDFPFLDLHSNKDNVSGIMNRDIFERIRLFKKIENRTDSESSLIMKINYDLIPSNINIFHKFEKNNLYITIDYLYESEPMSYELNEDNILSPIREKPSISLSSDIKSKNQESYDYQTGNYKKGKMANIDINKLSIEGYLYPDSFNDWVNVILSIHLSSGGRIRIMTNNNHQLQLNIGMTYSKKSFTAGGKYFVSSLKLKRKQWYHFKIIHNNKGVKFIINDQLETLTRENMAIDKNQVNGDIILLGCQSFDHRHNYRWLGKISGIKINSKNILWTEKNSL